MQPPEALLTIEKGEGAPVGVRANPELPVGWGSGVAQRRVAVDVEGVRSTVGTVLDQSGSMPRAVANQASSSAWMWYKAVVYRVHSARSLGISLGQTLSVEHVWSISGLPVLSSRPKARLSFRSGRLGLCP
jgi:hypothetical protein